jgi:hypothetical protein
VDDLFALILERASPRPVAEIGRLLACHLPVHATDATARVRYGGGLIAKDLPDDIAAELALRLGEIGVRTRKIASSRWAAAPRGSRVAALELGEDALTASLRGRVSLLTVPRRDVLGLRVHGVAAERPPGEDARNGGRRKRAQAEPGTSTLVEEAVASGAEGSLLSPRGSEVLRRLRENGIASMEMHITLYCAEPGPAAGEVERGWLWSPLRIAKGDFDYSSLGEQKQAHSLDNFLILLEELLAWLPDAWNRETAERFLSSLDPLDILHFKEEEAENFDRWMLEWVRIESAGREAEGRTP